MLYRSLGAPAYVAPRPQEGFLGSAVNGLENGFGGVLDSLGTYTDAEFGVGGGMAEYGRSIAQGTDRARDWSWQDIKDNPFGYFTDPSGFVYGAASMTGSSVPSVIASTAATGLAAATGGAAIPAEVAAAAGILGKVAPRAIGAVAGGFVDAGSEAGQTYQAALKKGMSSDEALSRANDTLGANAALGAVQNFATMNMYRNVKGVGGRLFGEAGEDAAKAATRELSGGEKLLNAISDFGDKNYKTRLGKEMLTNQTVEAYTEGLQNEIQNWALNGSQVQFNPFSMDEDSKTQMAEAFFGMAPHAMVGAIGHRKKQLGEATAEETPDVYQASPNPLGAEYNNNANEGLLGSVQGINMNDLAMGNEDSLDSSSFSPDYTVPSGAYMNYAPTDNTVNADMSIGNSLMNYNASPDVLNTSTVNNMDVNAINNTADLANGSKLGIEPMAKPDFVANVATENETAPAGNTFKDKVQSMYDNRAAEDDEEAALSKDGDSGVFQHDQAIANAISENPGELIGIDHMTDPLPANKTSAVNMLTKAIDKNKLADPITAKRVAGMLVERRLNEDKRQEAQELLGVGAELMPDYVREGLSKKYVDENYLSMGRKAVGPILAQKHMEDVGKAQKTITDTLNAEENKDLFEKTAKQNMNQDDAKKFVKTHFKDQLAELGVKPSEVAKHVVDVMKAKKADMKSLAKAEKETAKAKKKAEDEKKLIADTEKYGETYNPYDVGSVKRRINNKKKRAFSEYKKDGIVEDRSNVIGQRHYDAAHPDFRFADKLAKLSKTFINVAPEDRKQAQKIVRDAIVAKINALANYEASDWKEIYKHFDSKQVNKVHSLVVSYFNARSQAGGAREAVDVDTSPLKKAARVMIAAKADKEESNKNTKKDNKKKNKKSDSNNTSKQKKEKPAKEDEVVTYKSDSEVVEALLNHKASIKHVVKLSVKGQKKSGKGKFMLVDESGEHELSATTAIPIIRDVLSRYEEKVKDSPNLARPDVPSVRAKSTITSTASSKETTTSPSKATMANEAIPENAKQYYNSEGYNGAVNVTSDGIVEITGLDFESTLEMDEGAKKAHEEDIKNGNDDNLALTDYLSNEHVKHNYRIEEVISVDGDKIKVYGVNIYRASSKNARTIRVKMRDFDILPKKETTTKQATYLGIDSIMSTCDFNNGRKEVVIHLDKDKVEKYYDKRMDEEPTQNAKTNGNTIERPENKKNVFNNKQKKEKDEIAEEQPIAKEVSKPKEEKSKSEQKGLNIVSAADETTNRENGGITLSKENGKYKTVTAHLLYGLKQAIADKKYTYSEEDHTYTFNGKQQFVNKYAVKQADKLEDEKSASRLIKFANNSNITFNNLVLTEEEVNKIKDATTEGEEDKSAKNNETQKSNTGEETGKTTELDAEKAAKIITIESDNDSTASEKFDVVRDNLDGVVVVSQDSEKDPSQIKYILSKNLANVNLNTIKDEGLRKKIEELQTTEANKNADTGKQKGNKDTLGPNVEVQGRPEGDRGNTVLSTEPRGVDVEGIPGTKNVSKETQSPNLVIKLGDKVFNKDTQGSLFKDNPFGDVVIESINNSVKRIKNPTGTKIKREVKIYLNEEIAKINENIEKLKENVKGITAMSAEEFADWATNGNNTKVTQSQYKAAANEAIKQEKAQIKDLKEIIKVIPKLSFEITYEANSKELPIDVGQNKTVGDTKKENTVTKKQDAVSRIINFVVAILKNTGWHGSPFVIDNFDFNKIGSGEGTQAWGWGLYFTQSKIVALNRYKNGLINLMLNNGRLKVNNTEKYMMINIGDKEYKEKHTNISKLIDNIGKSIFGDEYDKSRQTIIKGIFSPLDRFWNKYAPLTLEEIDEQIKNNISNKINKFSDKVNNPSSYATKENIEYMKATLDKLVELGKMDIKTDIDFPHIGSLTEVSLPVDSQLLDLQKNIKSQDENIQDRVKKMLSELYQKQGKDEDYINQKIEQFLNEDGNKLKREVASLIGSNDFNSKEVSLTFDSYGIKGYTYKGGEDGRCYVIFSPESIEIKRRYDMAIKKNKEMIEDKRNSAIAEVEEMLKGYKSKTEQEDGIHYVMSNGSEIIVSMKDNLIINGAELEDAQKKHGINNASSDDINGYWQSLDASGLRSLIVVASDASKGTGYHEVVHAIWNMALSKGEIQILKDHFGPIADAKNMDVEELVANEIEKRKLNSNTVIGKIIQKMRDFVASAKKFFGKTDELHELLKIIENGEVWGEKRALDKLEKERVSFNSEKHFKISQKIAEKPNTKEEAAKDAKKAGIKSPQEVAKNSTKYGLLSFIKNKMSKEDKAQAKLGAFTRAFSDPRHIFEKYLPIAMDVYDLADKARRTLENKIYEYNVDFKKVFGGMSKEQAKGLNDLILRCNAMHQDPLNTVSVGGGAKFIALAHEDYIESFNDLKDAENKLESLRNSGNYEFTHKYWEDDGKGNGTMTVVAVKASNRIFDSEKDADAYVEQNIKNETIKQALENGVKDKKDAVVVAQHFDMYRKMMDKVWKEILAVAKANNLTKIAKRRNGYFPHMHLPYRVLRKVKDSEGNEMWEAVTSFYNATEASKLVDELRASGSEAQFLEMSIMDRYHAMINTEASIYSQEDIDRLCEGKQLTPEALDSITELLKNDNKALKDVIKKAFKNTNYMDKKAITGFVKKAVKDDSLAASQLRDLNFRKLLDHNKPKDGVGYTFEELESIINSASTHHRFAPHLLNQSDKAGYSLNVPEATHGYLVDIANMVAKTEFDAKATSVYKALFHRDWRKAEGGTEEEKFLREYIKANLGVRSITEFDNFMNSMLVSAPLGIGHLIRKFGSHTPYTDAAGTLLGMQNVLKLGMFNPSAFLVQSSQLLNANAKLEGKGVLGKMLGFSKELIFGIKMAYFNGKRADEKYKELFEKVGVGDKHFALDSEILGRPPTWKERRIYGTNVTLSQAMDKSMMFFQQGDTRARKASAIAAYEKAIKEGKSKEEAMDYAKHFVTDTNFDYSIANTPLALTKLGVTGKLLLQFKKYPLFTLNFLAHSTGAERVRFIVPLILMAGCFGVPCGDLFDEAVEKVSGSSPKKALQRGIMEWAGDNPVRKAIANVALYGAPSMAGINLSNRIGLNDAISFDAGPTYSTIKQFGSALFEGNAKGMGKALSPVVGNIESAYAGKYENSKGEIVTDYTVLQRLMKLAGFKPLEESKASDSKQILTYMRKRYSEALTSAKAEYVKNPSVDNYNALLVYGLSDKDIDKVIKESKQTVLEKANKQIPKNKKNKSSEAEEMRDTYKAVSQFSK